MGSCSFKIASTIGCLHSKQPIPADLHPLTTHSLVGVSEYTMWNCQTGHFSGSPASVRRTRAGSVGMVRTFLVTVSVSSRNAIVLP